MLLVIVVLLLAIILHASCSEKIVLMRAWPRGNTGAAAFHPYDNVIVFSCSILIDVKRLLQGLLLLKRCISVVVSCVRRHYGIFLRCSRLLLSLHHNLMSAASLSFLILGCATLGLPSHFIVLTGLFEHLHTIEVFHRDKLLLEIVILEVFVRGKAEYFFLFELTHEDLFHLPVRQLSVIVEAKSLNAALVILFKFKLVLYNVHSGLEDAFILDGLPDSDFTRPRP